MAYHCYRNQHLYYSLYLLIVFIFLIQNPNLTIAQPTEHIPTDPSDLHSTVTLTTTVFTILNNNNNNNHNDDHGSDNNVEQIYDDEEEDEEEGGGGGGDEGEDNDEDFSTNSHSKTISQVKLNNSRPSNINEETQLNEYDEEASSYQDDDDDLNNYIYTDAIPVNRPASKYPIINSNNNNYFDYQTTTRMSFTSSRFFRILFSKPAILVAIIGGICIGMLSAILLVMFIIYRMRKKDEGSYALEEAPRKSPLHAYSRVSSKEFYA